MSDLALHGELRKLGIEVSQTTVAKYLERRRTPPSPTWRTFLTTHVSQLASIDFFTVPTATFRVLFVRILLSHDRRRVVYVNVTCHPTAAWTRQQIREAFPWGPNAAVSAARSGRDLWLRLWSPVARFRIEDVVSAPQARPIQPSERGAVIERARVGGLHHSYERRAA